MKKNATLKISISGARGIVGGSLSPQLAATLAQAFGTYVGGGPVLVGRDARPSGIMLAEAVTAGLLSVGCRPVDVGILPIPSFLFLTKATKSAGGIAVTASHNPKDWNGLKFISRDGLYLTPHQTEEYLDIYHQGAFDFIPPGKYKTLQVLADAGEAHFRRLLDRFDSPAADSRSFSTATTGPGRPWPPGSSASWAARSSLCIAIRTGNSPTIPSRPPRTSPTSAPR
jgi:phosphomannomutase